MTRTPSARKPRQPRPAAPAAAPKPQAAQPPAPPVDPRQVILQAALETLGLEELPPSVNSLSVRCGPMAATKEWSWDHVRAYQLVHRRLVDAAAAARLAQQQGKAPES